MRLLPNLNKNEFNDNSKIECDGEGEVHRNGIINVSEPHFDCVQQFATANSSVGKYTLAGMAEMPIHHAHSSSDQPVSMSEN